MESARSYGFNVIDRPDYLSEDDANGDDLLLYDANEIDADCYFELFVTAPLLRSETIEEAYDCLVENPEKDSVFTVSTHNSFIWDDEGLLIMILRSFRELRISITLLKKQQHCME